MELIVTSDGWLSWPSGRVRCALGRGGVTPAAEKREGDQATPAGTFAIHRVLYRSDRLDSPLTVVPVLPLAPEDAWCDEPGDPAYNRPVTRPYPSSTETLWREDHLYDLVVVIGHNDDPVIPGRGSAIFFHLAHADCRPTQGCIAVARPDMEAILQALTPDSRVVVKI